MTLSKIRALVVKYSEKPHKFVIGEPKWDYNYSPPRMYQDMKPLPEILEAEGFAHLGSGEYAWVFDLGDGKRVVKVVKHEDEAYRKYAEYCKSSEKSSIKPRILFSGKWGRFDVYILEKLIPDERKARAVSAVYNMLRDGFYGYTADDTDQDFLVGLVDAKIGKSLAELIKGLQGKGCTDMHSGNIMFRENGELVITDPIC